MSEQERERRRRRAGVLAHISSLPSDYGVGDLGPGARAFVETIADIGLSAWQVLPMTPTDPGCGSSPYSSPSAFAGNSLFISPDDLAADGLVSGADLARCRTRASDRIDWNETAVAKKRLLETAHENFRADDAYRTKFKQLSDELWTFCCENAWWLEDYALFMTLKELSGGAAWSDWRPEFRNRDWGVLDSLKTTRFVARELDRIRFEQFLFFRQLDALREVCSEKGVELIGDIPIYVAHDSADVWGHRDLFALDEEGEPEEVAGVPPDLFSETGQRWGNPLYRWELMERGGWSWWMDRIAQALRMADIIRIDHFRGLLGYWAVPASESTAMNGVWRAGPGTAFLRAVRDRFAPRGPMPFIAEDLGVITDDVREAMDEFDFPGMKVLHFAFGPGMPKNPYAPHNHRRNCVVYTGTHDNNTSLGWWRDDATAEERRNFASYLGSDVRDQDASLAMIRLALSSTADLAIFTAQDALDLGSEARMNTPSTTNGNWSWRMTSLAPLRASADRIRPLLLFYDRADEDEIEEQELGADLKI